ncbi:MAG: sulfatase-like hydrolase/transferase [Acidobacteriota bacterium]
MNYARHTAYGIRHTVRGSAGAPSSTYARHTAYGIRHTVAPLLFLIPLLLLGCSGQTPKSTAAARGDLNVLLITIDTLRADYLSCYGKKGIQTPHLDGLARRGVRFAQAFAQVPLTSPSHASILTGAYPQVHKLRDIGGFLLDDKVPTLATVTRSAGLQTAAFVGSAVLNRRFRLDRGFETYNDDMGAQAASDKGNEKLPGIVAEVRAEVVTDRAIAWLNSALERGTATTPAKNFFLWAHYYDPHFPYDPPPPYRTGQDLYGGEIAYTDAQVGRLLEFLRQSGLQDRTLVVFLADHGESLGEHGEFTHGVFLYDSTMHVPLIVAGPGIPAGRVVTQQVRSIDVMPTVTALLGVNAGGQVQGASLVPALVEGKPVRTNYCYMETLYPKTNMGWSELRAMRTEPWKLIMGPKPELYRQADDRPGARNVVASFPAEADQLQKKIWEIAGPPEMAAKVQMQPIDEQTRQELQSLGYASAGASRELRIDMSGPDPKDRVAILRLLEQATAHMNHDRFASAVPLLYDAVRQDRTNPQLYQHLGVCFERSRQFQKALETYRLAIDNKATTDRTYASLGKTYVRLGDLPHAVEAMEQSARINPVDLDNLINLATAYLQLGNLEQGKRVLSAIVAQNGKHAGAHNLLGILEIQRGRGELAQQHFQKAVQYDPNLAEPYMNLGLLAQRAGRTNEAIENYKLFLAKAAVNSENYREVIPKVKAALAELKQP